VRPGEIEDAVGEMPILVFFNQADRQVARLGDARDDIDGHHLLRIERHQMANGDDRVEHRPLAARQRRALAHGQRRGGAARAAEKAQAIGFVGLASPGSTPCTAIRCSIQGDCSSRERGRRVHRIARRSRRISVCTKRLLKAGCSASAAGGASTTSA
jgi:hypothetical protein